jgi:hypothetical protein
LSKLHFHYSRSRPHPERSSAYYRPVLDALEKLDLQLAADTEGLDAEITLLRARIKTMLRTGADSQTLDRALRTLSQLVLVRHQIAKDTGINIQETIGNFVKGVAVPLSVAAISKKL